jgi:hypothetical protein
MFSKKIYAIFLSLLFIFSLKPINTTGFNAENCDIILKYIVGSKQYYVGDAIMEMDSEPEIKDSRMFLVIRFVLQNIPGTTLDWNGSERKITIKTPNGKSIKLWIGNPKAEVNGKLLDIDPENPGNIAPYIKDGRTKVPMRFVGEQLNARIDWISATSTVILTLFDTFNCDTTLLEGCISKWTEAPDDHYQIYFHKNCEVTKESVPYLIPKSLKSKTDKIDLSEFFQLKSAITKLMIKIWVTRSGKVRSWDPIPDSKEPPPPEPPDPKPPEPPIKKGRIIGTITGTCNPGVSVTIYDSSKGEVTWSGQTDINGYFETSTVDNCILKCPGVYKVVPSKQKYAFTESSQLVTFKENDCCDPLKPKSTIKKVNFKGVTTAGPGRIIASLGRESSRAITTFNNLSNPNAEILTIDTNIKGSCDTGCNVVFGDTYRVTPKNDGFRYEPAFIDVTVLESCPDGIIRVSFDAIEVPSSCCDWQFRIIPGVDPEKLVLSPGETRIIEIYEIVNNCNEGENDLKFAISWPKDGKIVSISPAIFTLVPKQRKTLIITIKMPEECKADEAIFFPFTIIPNDCIRRDAHLLAYCKAWNCNASTISMSVYRINQIDGWLEGDKFGTNELIRIYFKIGDPFWKKLFLTKCYQICYDERNNSSGKLIKWGLDYRVVECP